MKGLKIGIGARGVALAATSLALVFARQTNAQVVLHDGNSTAIIDPASQAGMFHWDIQGQNQLQQQWFWYGIDGQPVHSIDTISPPVITPKSPNEVTALYTAPGLFSVSIDYLLTGGSFALPGQHANADISESIKIVDLSGTVLPLHFYQYSYFNLDGASQDIVQLSQNARGQYNDALQQNGTSALSETVTTPGANEGEVAPLGATLAKLNGGGPVTLGPPFFAGPLGPGAVTWALQWDFLINPGGSALISKDKYLDVVIVPEPSVLAFAALGLGLALFKRRP
jgi:hypothetical protein